jgi:transposase-like protein
MSKKDGTDYGAKKALVLKALAEGGTTQAALAEKHGVSAVTIGRWARLKTLKPRASKKRKAKAKRAYRTARNGTVTNGHALAPPPPSTSSLDSVHADLTRALASVEAMREAFGRVFGGAP